MKTIILFGPPGVGKGTQAELLAKKFGYAHLSTGKMLREEAAKKSALGKQVEEILKSGRLVSDELIVKVVKNALGDAKKEGVILDGFPRTVNQAEDLAKILQQIKCDELVIVHIYADKDELVKRLMLRQQIEGRIDDSPEAIKHRLEVYEKETAPVLGWFNKKIPESVRNVCGIGSVEQIQSGILVVLKPRKKEE